MAETQKSTFGLDKNVACALTYLLGWITGLVFFLTEKEDKEIRFHAMQSIVFFGILTILGMFPLINIVLMPFISIISLVGWVFLLVKAYQGEHFKLPVIGGLAEKWANK